MYLIAAGSAVILKALLCNAFKYHLPVLSKWGGEVVKSQSVASPSTELIDLQEVVT